MINLISHHPNFVFSGNQIVFQLSSNNNIVSPGEEFVGFIQSSGFDSAMTFTFAFGDEHTEMYGYPGGDLSHMGNSFPIPATVAEALPFFQKNYLLSSHYDMSVSGDKMYFTAKKAGSFYNWKPGIGLNTETTGTDRTERPGFKFLFEIFLELESGGNIFTRIYSERLNQDLPFSGRLSIDIHNIIDAELEQDIPDPISAVPFRCTKSKRRFYCQYAEVYDVDTVIGQVSEVYQSPIYHVAKGGFSYIAELDQSAIGYLRPLLENPKNDRFLKQVSGSLRTRADQPQWLYFVNMRETRLLYLKTDVTYTDGTVATQKVTSLNLAQYEKATFPVGFDQQQLGLLEPDKVPVSYSCQLVSAADDELSEIITYQVDTDYKEWPRYLLYSSSLGSFDSFLTYGKEVRETSLDQKVSERAKLIGYKLTDGTKKSYGLNAQRDFTVNTGFLQEWEFNLLTDFYLSEDKFLSQPGKFIPFSVTNKKVANDKDGNTLKKQEISFSLNFTDTRYTQNDMKGSAPILPPLTGLVHYGPSTTRPMTAAQVVLLPVSQPDEIREFVLHSGNTGRFFTIAYPAYLELHEVYNATAEEDVTSEYLKNRLEIEIDGIPYKVDTAITAKNYSVDQEHEITLANE